MKHFLLFATAFATYVYLFFLMYCHFRGAFKTPPWTNIRRWFWEGVFLLLNVLVGMYILLALGVLLKVVK